jgi:hypothetical protein
MTTDRPWESEPDSLDFEADGLPCAMRRGLHGIWCGYVGIDPEHPLFGLPTNHPLKLPPAWFANRRGLEGTGPMDVLMHVLHGKPLDEACEISLAFQVHGGVNYAHDHAPDHEPDGRWWFGFDCGHAGDYLPDKSATMMQKIMNEMMDSMPEAARGKMREIMSNAAARPGVYRDQQYVVGECQSLAAQLIAVVTVIAGEKIDGQQDRDG